MKFKLEFNSNGTWVNDDKVSEGAALAMLNGYAALNEWAGASNKELYRIVPAPVEEIIYVRVEIPKHLVHIPPECVLVFHFPR